MRSGVWSAGNTSLLSLQRFLQVGSITYLNTILLIRLGVFSKSGERESLFARSRSTWLVICSSQVSAKLKLVFERPNVHVRRKHVCFFSELEGQPIEDIFWNESFQPLFHHANNCVNGSSACHCLQVNDDSSCHLQQDYENLFHNGYVWSSFHISWGGLLLAYIISLAKLCQLLGSSFWLFDIGY